MKKYVLEVCGMENFWEPVTECASEEEAQIEIEDTNKCIGFSSGRSWRLIEISTNKIIWEQ